MNTDHGSLGRGPPHPSPPPTLPSPCLEAVLGFHAAADNTGLEGSCLHFKVLRYGLRCCRSNGRPQARMLRATLPLCAHPEAYPAPFPEGPPGSGAGPQHPASLSVWFEALDREAFLNRLHGHLGMFWVLQTGSQLSAVGTSVAVSLPGPCPPLSICWWTLQRQVP